MNIDFNNVRKQAIYRHDELVKKLNDAIIKEDQWAKPNDASWDININGYVLIDSENLNKVLNDLRMIVGTIAMTYEENSLEFSNVYEEVFPEGSDKRMEIFNKDKEE
ncbi:MAG: hypothetical protein WAT79_08720 [Saprospiraceae bacterium]